MVMGVAPGRIAESTKLPGRVNTAMPVLALDERLREKMLRENAAGDIESPVDQIRTATLRPDARSGWRRILELAEKMPKQHPWCQIFSTASAANGALQSGTESLHVERPRGLKYNLPRAPHPLR